MFSLSLKGVSVSAPSLEALETLLSNLGKYSAQIEAAGVASVPKVATVQSAAMRGANVAKWLRLTDSQRFRMKPEEKAIFGDTPEGREACAIERLQAMGASEATEGEGGAEGGASVAGGAEDEELTAEALAAIHDDDDDDESDD